MENIKVRNTGIDLVKAIAVLFVISVHFLCNTGFYETKIDNSMFVPMFLFMIFYTCVPLFLVTTGYLMKDKVLGRKYYYGLIRIVLSYVLISFCAFLVKKYYIGQPMSLFTTLREFQTYILDGYAWYVNMYIGLFLLIPFLNILYKALDEKQKKAFIITLVALSSFWVITTTWWQLLYPISYYFIGVYINENKVTFKKRYLMLIALGAILLQCIESYVASGVGPFNQMVSGYGNFLTIVITVSIFLLFYRVSIANRIVKGGILTVSKLTLEIYLFSYIIDIIVYPYLLKLYPTVVEVLPYFVVVVPSIFLGSVVLAIVLNAVQKPVVNLIIKRLDRSL